MNSSPAESARSPLLQAARFTGIALAAAILAPSFTGCASVPGGVAPAALRNVLLMQNSAYEQGFERESLEQWQPDKEAVVAWTLADGRYQATTSGDDATVSLYTGGTWTGALAEVDYSLARASAAAGGMVVRATPDFRGWAAGSGYLFCLGSDGVNGQFAVYRQVGGVMQYLQAWATNAAIQGVSNRLGVASIGDFLQFYVNGQLVWEGHDPALAEGYVGLVGSTSPGSEATHVFDNLLVKAAPSFLAVAKPRPAKSDKKGRDEAGVGRSKEDKSPLLRPGLLIRVTVLVSGKRGVDAEVRRVTDNSQVDLPLIGPVSVKGMTLAELNGALQVWYQDFFIDPQVLAEFVVEERPDAASPWGSVVVLGRVKTPGRVNIPATQDLTVSGAIQQAGGLDTSARSSAIRLTRRKPDGGTERLTVNFSDVGKRGDVDKDLILKPGDVIFVPEGFF
jgi:polysaccharide export outer membrane protein